MKLDLTKFRKNVILLSDREDIILRSSKSTLKRKYKNIFADQILIKHFDYCCEDDKFDMYYGKDQILRFLKAIK